jgi:endonuclease YncB( thermonuclease family)
MRKPADFENHPASYEYARSIGCFRAVCKKVVDGDTFDVFIDLGMNNYAYDTIRLHDFDTPEIFHPSNTAERNHGMAARARVVDVLDQKPVLIRSFKDQETFGRYVADVYYLIDQGDGWIDRSLAVLLAEEGFKKRESYA